MFEPQYSLRFLPPLAIAGLALAILVLAAVVITEFRARNRARSFVDYVPDELTPGLAALMVSRGTRMTPAVLLTMLVELEQRGEVTARADPKITGEWWFAKAQPGVLVSDAERALLFGMFGMFGNAPYITVRHLVATMNPGIAAAVRQALHAEGRPLDLTNTIRVGVSVSICILMFSLIPGIYVLGELGFAGAGVAGVSLIIAGAAVVWQVGFSPLTRYGAHVRDLLHGIGQDTLSGGPGSVAEKPAWAVAVGAAERASSYRWPGTSDDGFQGYATNHLPYYADPSYHWRWTTSLRDRMSPMRSLSGGGIHGGPVTGFGGGGFGGGGFGGGGGGGFGGGGGGAR